MEGVVHLALGDTEAAARSEEAATRTFVVLAAGALTAGTGGAAAPILAGVVAGVSVDAALTGSSIFYASLMMRDDNESGVESYRRQKYDPQAYLGALSELSSDWRGGAFDIVALGVGDAAIGQDGASRKTSMKTTKVRQARCPCAMSVTNYCTALGIPY